MARKLEVCSPLNGVEAQVGKCIDREARMEWTGVENESNQTRDQPHENVQALRRGTFNSEKRRKLRLNSTKDFRSKAYDLSSETR